MNYDRWSGENMEERMTLVVDLDGTLLKSDMLHECFWNAFSKNWLVPILALVKLIHGKAALKDYLASISDIDVSLLPYENQVIRYIESRRAVGEFVALVTATNHNLAKKIADHLGIFDEVHGSSLDRNLKGQHKAQFLLDHYGVGNFYYLGDSTADIAVWQVSQKIMTVNASKYLCEKVSKLGRPIEHLISRKKYWFECSKALRLHQWSKNILIFLPMMAAHHFDTFTLFKSLWAFLAFCLVASSVYVLNDLLDLGPDRAHPSKRFRPFASGSLPISYGTLLVVILFILGFSFASILGSKFVSTLLLYFALTSLYSLSLKKKVVLDICVLAGLYTMRIVAGSIATNIHLSVWMFAFSIFFFLSLAAVKRQAELVDPSNNLSLSSTRRGYVEQDLPIISIISLSAGYISVLVMALYISSESVLSLYQNPEMLWGICCVLLYWISRVVLITHRGYMHHDPIIFAFTDQTSRICFLVITGFIISGVLF